MPDVVALGGDSSMVLYYLTSLPGPPSGRISVLPVSLRDA